MGQKRKPRQLTGLMNFIPAEKRELRFCGLCRLNHHKTSAGAFINELDGACDLGEECVIFAAADICSCLDWCTALAHDDCATGNKLAAERFYTQPLRV